MKKVFIALGAAAAVCLAPYRIDVNPGRENGTLSLRALLWRLSLTPNDEGHKQLNVELGPVNPFGCHCDGSCHCHKDEADETGETADPAAAI